MTGTAFTVRLKGDLANLVDYLAKKGYVSSKTELIRTALIFYAMKLGIFSRKKLFQDAIAKISTSGKKYTDEEIKKQISSIR